MHSDYTDKTIWTFLEDNKKSVILFLLGGIITSLLISFFGHRASGRAKIESSSSTTSSVSFSNSVTDSTALDTKPKSLVVEIAGAVLNPGVYEVSESARVIDLVLLSGGFTKEADARQINKNLNLAEKLTDSQKVYVPYKGELLEAFNLPLASGSALNSESASKTILINLNKATASEIDSLPGIGPTFAARIIANRPYKDFDDLVTRSKVTKSTLTKIKDMVTF